MKKLESIPAVTDIESQGKRIYNKLYILAEEDVDYSKLPEIQELPTGRTMAELTLVGSAPGWKEFNFAKYTLGATSEGSQGDITSTVTNSLMGTIGGERDVLDDFLENALGRPVFIVEVDRFTKKKRIYGRPYSPMFVSAFSKRKNAENTSCDITFSQESFFQPLEYLGDPAKPAGVGG